MKKFIIFLSLLAFFGCTEAPDDLDQTLKEAESTAGKWSDYVDMKASANEIQPADTFLVRDVDDTTLASTGTQKQYKWSDLLLDLGIYYPRAVVADGDTNPTVNDDIDTATGAATPVLAGYLPGDIWINDTASPTTVYVCISNADGAAVWRLNGTEEETHASEHTIGGADITDRLFEGVTVAAITVGDATPPVASKGLYITTGATAITITDFYDSGDDNDGDFADGDYFGLIVEDVDVIIDFATGTNIKGNADTNLTGLASNPLLLIFVWRSGVWYCVNFNSGFSNALTMAAKIATPTPVSGATASFLGTFTGANLYGGTYIATSDDGDSVLPLMAVGMNFCIITKGAIQVVVATNANDGYFLDGVDTAEDNSVVNTSTAGDIACFQYYTADDWLITTNGWATE